MTYDITNNNKNIFDNQNFVFGVEPEFNTRTYTEMNRINNNSAEPIKGLEYVYDGSRVDGEGRLPILSNSLASYKYLRSVLEQLQENGATVNWTCSVHIHVSRRPIIIDPTEFHNRSIEYTRRTGSALPSSNGTDYFGDAIPLEILKDIGYRVSKNKDQFNSFLAPSRIDDGGYANNAMRRARQPNGYFCKMPLSHTMIRNTEPTWNKLKRVISTGDKYSAINIHHWSNKETIEYRSHGGTLEIDKIWSWIQFLINMTRHSINARHNQVQSVIDTPDYIGRSYRTRQSIAYQLMRRVGGATTQEIMDATGIQTAQRVRSMISEQIRPVLRQRFGRDILITHNQQHYNHAYSTSQGRYDLNGYEIPLQVNNASGGCVFANNGRTDLLSGLLDQHKRHLKPFRN
tara:strand:- start:198 stop:1403 length:1206 start_codon:yes stop_codon:yes gene_type:complete